MGGRQWVDLVLRVAPGVAQFLCIMTLNDSGGPGAELAACTGGVIKWNHVSHGCQLARPFQLLTPLCDGSHSSRRHLSVCPCPLLSSCKQPRLKSRVLTLTSEHSASVPFWQWGCRAADRKAGVLLLSADLQGLR